MVEEVGGGGGEVFGEAVKGGEEKGRGFGFFKIFFGFFFILDNGEGDCAFFNLTYRKPSSGSHVLSRNELITAFELVHCPN